MLRRMLACTFVLLICASCGTKNDLFVTRSEAPEVQAAFGRIVIQPAFPLIRDAERREVASYRDQLERDGRFLTRNNEMLLWPELPGSNWIVRIGNQEVTAGPDGTFAISLPSGITTGELLHPSDEDLSPVKFNVNLLGGQAGADNTLVVPLFFHGGCGMSPDEFCGTSQERARYVPPDYDPQAPPNFFWGVERKPRGTYPPSDAHITNVAGLTCPQYDGYGDDGVLKVSGERYVGSTCDLNVVDGACPNENPLSDVEYRAFAEGLNADIPVSIDEARAFALGILHRGREEFLAEPGEESRLLTPPSKTGLFDGSCIKNHKGKMCGMFEAGDVSVDIGEIIRGGEQGVLKVVPGQTGSITVHNNGITGFTNVQTPRFDPEITLDWLNLDDKGGIRRIEHFDDLPLDPNLPKNKRHRYVADRIVEFEVDRFAEPGSTVSYRFTVDDKTAVLTFEVTEDEVAIFPPKVQLLNGELSQGFSATPRDPGLLYRWFLSFNTGTLSSDSESEIVYSVRDPGSVPFSDVLNLEVYRESRDGSQELVGKAAAEIFVGNVDIQVTPASASLAPGTDATFSASVFGIPPGETTIFEWESANGLGTLSSTDGQSTTYTVLESVIPPQADVLRLTVFSEDPQGNQTVHGVANIPIKIRTFPRNPVVVLRRPDELEILTYQLDPASGQMARVDGSLQLGQVILANTLPRLILGPDGLSGHVYRENAPFDFLDTFLLDPNSGRPGSSFTLEAPEISFNMAVGSNLLFVAKIDGNVKGFGLDAIGVPTLEGFDVPGTGSDVDDLEILPSATGEDMVLYVASGGSLLGYRVDGGSAQAVAGSPLALPMVNVLDKITDTAIHPSRRFLIVLVGFGLSHTGNDPRRLVCVEVDPADGDLLGIRDVIELDGDSLSTYYLSVSSQGFVFVTGGSLEQTQAFTVNESGDFVTQAASPVTGLHPSVDGSGQYLVLLSLDSISGSNLESYQIDPSTGALTPAGSAALPDNSFIFATKPWPFD